MSAVRTGAAALRPQPSAAAPARRPVPLTDRGWYLRLADIAGMITLLFATLRSVLTPPFTWRRECVEQCWIIVKRCTLPLVISTFAFGLGAPGTDGGNIQSTFGSADRMGSTFVTATVREFAPFITGMVLAGVAGTAICADLGARKVRDELDALEVLGINPVAYLVAPRFVALGVMTALMNLIGVVAATLSGLVAATVEFHSTAASYFATFSQNFAPPELWGSLLKTSVFGFLIAVVCCYKGMHVRGGSEGVGRGVNQAVVLCFVAIFVVNYLWNAVLLASFPEVGEIR